MKQPALWAAVIAVGLMSACASGGGGGDTSSANTDTNGETSGGGAPPPVTTGNGGDSGGGAPPPATTGSGGTSGGGAPPPVTTSPTARTAAVATKAAFAAFAAGSSALQKPGGSAGSSKSGIVIRALDILKNHITPPHLSAKALQAPSPCPGGSGTMESIRETSRNLVEATLTITTKTVYDNCVSATVGNTETYRDGSMAVSTTLDALFIVRNVTVEFVDYTNGQRSVVVPASQVRLRDDTIDGVLSASNVVPYACGSRTILTSADASVTATLTTYLDVDGNGTAEVDEAVVAENLGVHLTQEYDRSDCRDTKMTVTANGDLKAVDHVDTTGQSDFSATLTGFTIVETPAARGIVSGTEVTIDGTISVTSECETGTFTVSTKTALFAPDSTASDCPTEGEVVVSGDGTRVSVIATSTGGVQFDEGGDGTIEQKFDNCDEADICSTT